MSRLHDPGREKEYCLYLGCGQRVHYKHKEDGLCASHRKTDLEAFRAMRQEIEDFDEETKAQPYVAYDPDAKRTPCRGKERWECRSMMLPDHWKDVDGWCTDCMVKLYRLGEKPIPTQEIADYLGMAMAKVV